MPANCAGVAAYAPHDYGDEVPEWRFSVEILEAGEFRHLPVKITPVEEFFNFGHGLFVVAPVGTGLKPGATYRFAMERTLGSDLAHKQLIVEIDHETLSEESEFTLDVGPVTEDSISVSAGGLCSKALDVSQVRIRGSLARDVERWREQLLFRTIVDDGILWNPTSSLCQNILPGRSWEEVGHDRIFGPCPGQTSGLFIVSHVLKQGAHTMMMQAFLPGTGVVLETMVESVVFSCSGS